MGQELRFGHWRRWCTTTNCKGGSGSRSRSRRVVVMVVMVGRPRRIGPSVGDGQERLQGHRVSEHVIGCSGGWLVGTRTVMLVLLVV